MENSPILPADWPAPRGVHGFTTLRYGAGVSLAPFDRFNLGNRTAADGDDSAAVDANRAALIGVAGLPSVPVWLRQVHGVEVLRAGERPHTRRVLASERSPSGHFLPPAGNAARPHPPFGHLLPQAGEGSAVGPLRISGGGTAFPPLPLAGEGWGEGPGRSEPEANAVPALPEAGEGRGEGPGDSEPEADASVTSVPGTVLAILTADCLPVLFCADDGSEVGAAHAGWRGLAGGVLEATVAAMETPPERLMAWLGPAAGPQRYEVGAEVRDALVSRDHSADSAFTVTRPNHWNVDLYALARRRLERAGLGADRIFGGGLCTISEPQRFYSHRRDQRTGRIASLVWMAPR